MPFLLRRASYFSKYTDVDVRPYSVSSIESQHQLTRYYCLQWTLNQTQLRQREIVTTYPQEQERISISSITKNLEKIVFKSFNIQSLQPFLGDPCWTPFDSRLDGLVNRLRASVALPPRDLVAPWKPNFSSCSWNLVQKCTTGALSLRSRRKVASERWRFLAARIESGHHGWEYPTGNDVWG